jgi:transcriptional regulator with XRE-family HTH domain
MPRQDPQQTILLTLGQRLLSARKHKRWTQAEAAHYIGYSVREIQRWEAGKRNMSVVILARIARHYDTQPWVLLKPVRVTLSRKPGRPKGGKWPKVIELSDGTVISAPRPPPRKRRARSEGKRP